MKNKDDVKGDLLAVESYKYESFKIVIDGYEYYDEKDAGIAISEVLKAKPFEKDNRIQVGFFKGMNVYIERDVFGD